MKLFIVIKPNSAGVHPGSFVERFNEGWEVKRLVREAGATHRIDHGADILIPHAILDHCVIPYNLEGGLQEWYRLKTENHWEI